MRAAALLAVGLLACSGPARAAGVEVRVQGERVSLRATAAPLADILDRLAKETGMKVVYEGAAPRLPLTATLEGRTPLEAVLGLLEGTGLNYAVMMDAGGLRVDTLLMAGVGGTGPAAPGALAPAAPAYEPPRVRTPGPQVAPAAGADAAEEPQAEEEEPQAEEDEAPATDEEAQPERAPLPTSLVPPNAGFPSSPFAPQPTFPGLAAGDAQTPQPSPSPPPKEDES